MPSERACFELLNASFCDLPNLSYNQKINVESYILFSHARSYLMYDSHVQQIMSRVDVIVQSGSELEQNPHTDQQTVHSLMSKIQTFMSDFDQKIGKRKRKLSDSVRLHKLIEKVLCVCLWRGGGLEVQCCQLVLGRMLI